ncbi:DUF938 domain-containing protein [Shewanella canadensis]|uniref:DUF938 domain-containing protein n=1 Tax=Shewanella canadensis TaxID=271096 RepID=A0A3S0L248_9GAMM|nr:DUF938 domain-containing protein [Shewanella canadensis]RTR39578.1 DUF938 domain-containing protein [Shewanella canadensis]
MSQLPFSQSCENNKAPILDVIKRAFAQSTHVLEIGTGSAQHATYFSRYLPHLIWQTSDQADYLEGIEMRLAQTDIPNLKSPLVLDVTKAWPLTNSDSIDAIFTANTLHIMSKEMVEAFFCGIGEYLAPTGQLCIYGPFNYAGEYSSESNARFDIWLKERDHRSAIRDIEWIQALAIDQGLTLTADHPMPANNRLLHLTKI